MIKVYLNLLNIEYEIINVDCVNGEENSYTINHALSNKKFIARWDSFWKTLKKSI